MWLRPVPWDAYWHTNWVDPGLSTTGTNSLFYAYTNGDSLVIGKLYDAVTLGYYSQGFRIANLPILMFYSALDHVLLPAYASIRDEKARQHGRFSAVIVCSRWWLLPVAVGLLILAPELVIVLVGEKWRESIPFLQVFAVQGFRAVNTRSFPHLMLSALTVLITRYCRALAVMVTDSCRQFSIVIVFRLASLGDSVCSFERLYGRARHRPCVATVRSEATNPEQPDFVRQALPVMLSAAAMALLVLGTKHLIVMSFGSAATVPILLILGPNCDRGL